MSLVSCHISLCHFTITFIFLFGLINCNGNYAFGNILKCGVALSPLIGVLCMALSITLTFVISKFTRKPSDEIIERAFESNVEGLIN